MHRIAIALPQLNSRFRRKKKRKKPRDMQRLQSSRNERIWAFGRGERAREWACWKMSLKKKAPISTNTSLTPSKRVGVKHTSIIARVKDICNKVEESPLSPATLSCRHTHQSFPIFGSERLSSCCRSNFQLVFASYPSFFLSNFQWQS